MNFAFEAPGQTPNTNTKQPHTNPTPPGRIFLEGNRISPKLLLPNQAGDAASTSLCALLQNFVKRRICVSMGCTSVLRLCLCQGGCSAHTTWQCFKGCGNPSKIQITLLWGSQSNAAHGTKPTLRSQKTLMAAIHHGSLQAMAPEGELRELPHSSSARARAGLWNHPWDTGWEIGWV